MKLPNSESVEVPAEKVRDYLLSSEHPIGRFKARFFLALGYDRGAWAQLQADLQRLASLGDAEPGQRSPFGTKYEVRGSLRGPNGRVASLVTVWIVTNAGDAPRLVTAFPGEGP